MANQLDTTVVFGTVIPHVHNAEDETSHHGRDPPGDPGNQGSPVAKSAASAAGCPYDRPGAPGRRAALGLHPRRDGRRGRRMSHLDDLPKRDSSHRIEEQSKTAFRAAVSECEEFVIQSDRHDYGTDFVIEANDAGAMTNVRIHVQLKGTGCEQHADGSVGVSIDRTNLNYLAMQPGSIFVCYHTPTERLLVRRVDDVVREYEHRGSRWRTQQTVTVTFRDVFDQDFQQSLKAYAVASAKGARDHRLFFAKHPPEALLASPVERAIDLPVPADPKQAKEMLLELYDRGRDWTISRSFEKFRAVLGPSDATFLMAYMAEINLARISHRVADSGLG